MSNLAERIGSLSLKQSELLRLRLAEQKINLINIPILPQARNTEAFPLSYAQQRLWFLDQLEPDAPVYTLAFAVHLTGRLDLTMLRCSLDAVVQRHSALRTIFVPAVGEPVQVIPSNNSVALLLLDLQRLPTATREATLRAVTAEEARRPFDLGSGPLLRVTLVRLAAQTHVLLVTLHHIVADSWSLGVFVRELAALYDAGLRGEPAHVPDLPIQYVDYAVWQQEWVQVEVLAPQLNYWQQQLADLPMLRLPTDHPRPSFQRYCGATHAFALPKRLSAALKELSQRRGVTLFMTLLAAWQVLLARYSGQTDFAIGVPMAHRWRPELEGLIGMFANPLVLRANLAGDPQFDQVLERVRTICVAAYEHQDVPFEWVVEALQPKRDVSHNPLFQALFVLQNAPLPPLKLAGLTLSMQEIDTGTAKFDLTLSLTEHERELEGRLEYDTDLFDAPTIAGMVAHFQTLLEGIVAEPGRRISQMPLLSDGDRRQLAEWSQGPGAAVPELCLHELVAAQAQLTPDRVALVFKHEQLTYRELDRRSNQLAHHLRAYGVGPDVLVGLYIERSLEMLVGMLGTLKAGGAYVSLDPALPVERLAFMLEDSQAAVLLVAPLTPAAAAAPPLPRTGEGAGGEGQRRLVDLAADWPSIAQAAPTPPASVTADSLAYVLYTSGSTGQPKGVMISQRNLVNFCIGMDACVGCGPDDTLLAATSIAFDISVLELLWTLTRGARVILLDEEAVSGITKTSAAQLNQPINFSLFYFASDDASNKSDKYRLVLEGAKFADQHGFTAVWTPERHFHAFGGLYPNPSVMSAALATITKRIHIRAGSVVLPLHSPIRVAEEWALVDNLSQGRVGVAFASGWHADDFVFFPEHYGDRKNIMFQSIEAVQQLWRGETLQVRGGAGNELAVQMFPQPIQDELPIWITSAGHPETFVRAGAIGANVLTHLLGQSIEDVAANIRRYRESLAEHGHDPQRGIVTLMLHTFIGEDIDAVRDIVRAPFTSYLRSSIGLIENLIRSLNLPLDLQTISAQDMDDLLALAFDRYFETSALFGTPETCCAMIDRLKASGVDEVACLVDFGVETDVGLAHLQHLNELRERVNPPIQQQEYSLVTQAAAYCPSLMQCTPSMMRLLTLDPQAMKVLGSLRTLLLGGEALPPSLASELHERLPARLLNMYGPTETTVWSAAQEFEAVGSTTTIGRPILNTHIYVLDPQLQPVPAGVVGELYIGGAGLARGYYQRPDLTAERFVPNPFAEVSGIGCRVLGAEPSDTQYPTSDTRYPTSDTRLYKTGDLARHLPDGTLEFLGRTDHQVKLRGYRIELGEIEAHLRQWPAVREAIVAAREDEPGNKLLVAYVVMEARPPAADAEEQVARELRAFLAEKLPSYMIPTTVVFLDALPLTPNGKIDRASLPIPNWSRAADRVFAAPRTSLEQRVAQIFVKVLGIDNIGIYDDFFELGGHSLLAAQLIAEVQVVFGVHVPLRAIFRDINVANLAGAIERAGRAAERFGHGTEAYYRKFLEDASVTEGIALDEETFLDPAIAPEWAH